MRDSVSFHVNGVKKEVKGAQVFQSLSSFLRYDSGLTGTKVVCAEGDCGACSVMLAKSGGGYEAVNSCIAMVFAMDGANLVTVEGLSPNGELSEVQCSMTRNFGAQCGFCTPGFVVAITNMLEQKKENITAQNAKNYLTGNLCRCTGYAPILQAALDVNPEKHKTMAELYPVKTAGTEPVLVSSPGSEFYAPVSLAEACAYKARNPDARIFAGATDLGVQYNKGHVELKKILSLHLIPELREAKVENGTAVVGARVTLAELEKLVAGQIPSFENFLHIFASPQIKNSATLAGNLANASPIADTTPVMLALDAVLHLRGAKVARSLPLKDFYLGYKKMDLRSDEIITHVSFKIPGAKNKVENYKVSQRRDLDISTVNASFNFELDGKKIKSARIAYGGLAATTIRLLDIESELENRELSPELIENTRKRIAGVIKPLSDHRGSGEYRKLVAVNLFTRYAESL